MTDVKRDEGTDTIAIVWRVCMLCKEVIGTRLAVSPSEVAGDVTHGVHPECRKLKYGF